VWALRPELKARLLAMFPYWQWIKGTEHLTSYVTIHACSGDRARATLVNIAFAQQAFQTRSGRPANSLTELGISNQILLPNIGGTLTSSFRIEYEKSGGDWWAYVPRQADLPGHYLVLSNGVYFCEARRPTTNDYPLAFFK
jgi:hypothetical protein